MTQDDILRMMRNQGGQQRQVVKESVEKLDEFIDRCLAKDETLQTLGHACQLHLQQGRIVSYVEQEVLPQVLNRINERLQKGEV